MPIRENIVPVFAPDRVSSLAWGGCAMPGAMERPRVRSYPLMAR